MTDLIPVMKFLRAMEEDPDLGAVWLEIASEVVTKTGNNDEHVFDPAYLELSNGDRDAYLTAQAGLLMPALMRAGITWALFDSETVEAWQERTGRVPVQVRRRNV